MVEGIFNPSTPKMCWQVETGESPRNLRLGVSISLENKAQIQK